MIEEIIEEINEVESVMELEALVNDMFKDNPALSQDKRITQAIASRRSVFEVLANPTEERPKVSQDVLQEQLAEMQKKYDELAAKLEATTVRQKSAPRYGRRYKVVNASLDWTKKPQIHAVMRILVSEFGINVEAPEDQIVAAMERNEALFNTRQGGKRIWDYYKGNSTDGLMAHGNIVQC